MTWARGALAVPVLSLLAVYLPAVGHGFVKDDFAWIGAARAAAAGGIWSVFETHNGFYRPLVTLSFFANDWLFGLAPRAYGLTNLALLLACVVVMARLDPTTPLAVLGPLLWAFNPHGVSAGLLWISGRTSILLTLFALLAARATLRGRRWPAAGWTLLALLSKEEAVLLPGILTVWAATSLASADEKAPDSAGRGRLRAAAHVAGPLLLSLGIYLLLRSRTGAYVPWTAPAFYRPTLDLGSVFRNAIEYFDRSCTLSLVALLLGSFVLRARPRPSREQWAWVIRGFAWTVGGFGLTVFVPARSPLYALFPSVGVAVAVAALLGAAWEQAGARARKHAVGAGLAASVALALLLQSRTVRSVKEAELSTRVLVGLASAGFPADAVIVVRDQPGSRYPLANSFGTLFEPAVRLWLGAPALRAWVDPPPPGWETAGLLPPAGAAETPWRFALVNGALVRWPDPSGDGLAARPQD